MFGNCNWKRTKSTFEFFTVRISVRLSNVTQNKIHFIKNCSSWQPPKHQSHALPTELSYYLAVGVNH